MKKKFNRLHHKAEETDFSNSFLLQSCKIILKCLIKKSGNVIKCNVVIISWTPIFFIVAHPESRELLLHALDDKSTLLNSQKYNYCKEDLSTGI